MIKELFSVEEHMDFINEINGDRDFKDPMLCTEEQIRCNLFEAVNRETNHIYGVFEKQKLTGLFVFLILEKESYMEMLVGLSKNEQAYKQMLTFLKNEYKGYRVDFVYNPNNYILHSLLQQEKAEFEIEQQKMILKKKVAYQTHHHVELFSEKYRDQYVAMHATDVYWTAERVIAATDRFRIILAIENEKVVGYIDITHKYDENEPYDVFVKPEYRRKGYAKAMLAKAIELNRPHGMMLLVDIDNVAAIALYESLGFKKAIGENNITAHLSVKKGIVVVFTGSRGTEIPLLYYAAKTYVDQGYEKVLITCRMTNENEFSDKYSEILQKTKELNLKEYSDVIFISKSIGTYISCRIKKELGLDAKLVLFTPIEETMEFINKDNDVLFVAAGDNDRFLESGKLVAQCVSQKIAYYIEPGVGHGMEIPNNLNRNLLIVRNVIEKMPVE